MYDISALKFLKIQFLTHKVNFCIESTFSTGPGASLGPSILCTKLRLCTEYRPWKILLPNIWFNRIKHNIDWTLIYLYIYWFTAYDSLIFMIVTILDIEL